MIEKNKIKYAVILILFLVFAWIFVRNNNNKENINEAPKKSVAPVERAYSRISFFHSRPVKASLSIPEEWEGKYRMKENGDSVNFYYIGDANKESLLFSVNIKNINNSDNQDGEIEITQKGDFAFNYKLSTANDDAVSGSNDYKNIIKDIPVVISSFKIF